MLDRRLGQDAVTEIEDMGAALKAAPDPLDLLVEAPSPRDQREGIEIALERQPVGQSSDSGSGVGGGVEADRVNVGQGAELGELRSRAARKGDQPRARRPGANPGGDRLDRR